MRRLALLGSLVLVAAALATGASGGTPNDITDPVWSGYAAHDASTAFKHVRGSWVEPSANCSGLHRNTKTYAAIWVGLDGYSSNTVEQAGTEVDCVGTTESHIGWYAFIPKTYVKLDPSTNPVAAGDGLTVDVGVSGGTVTITLSDDGAGNGTSWSISPTAPVGTDALSSAEWIVESLSQKLTHFSRVCFTGTSASTATVTNGAIDDAGWTTTRLTMVNHGGQNASPKDSVSGLGDAGCSFHVDWVAT